DYPSGSVTCREGPCPEGLACVDNVCVVPIDAAPDGTDATDAREPSLTCVDPGTLSLHMPVSDSTTGRMNLITAACGGFVNNGLDAVYKVDVPSGTQITLDIQQGSRKAYVLSLCQQSPQTPNCIGNTRAVLGAPISVTTTTTPSFVV